MSARNASVSVRRSASCSFGGMLMTPTSSSNSVLSGLQMTTLAAFAALRQPAPLVSASAGAAVSSSCAGFHCGHWRYSTSDGVRSSAPSGSMPIRRIRSTTSPSTSGLRSAQGEAKQRQNTKPARSRRRRRCKPACQRPGLWNSSPSHLIVGRTSLAPSTAVSMREPTELMSGGATPQQAEVAAPYSRVAQGRLLPFRNRLQQCQ